MSKQTVTILENWKVEIDPMNHTLYKYDEGGKKIEVGKFKGQLSKPKWTEVGFYPNLKQCLKRILLEESLMKGVADIQQYLNRLEDIHKKLEVVYE